MSYDASLVRKRDAAEARRNRIRWLQSIIFGFPEGVHIKRLIALAVYNIGLTEQKTREYLDWLENLEYIRIDGDFIFPNIQKPKDEPKKEEPKEEQKEESKDPGIVEDDIPKEV